MTGWGRAFYGAAFGSIITLIAHPASRPLILGYWCQPSSLVTRATSDYIQAGKSTLPPPKSLEDASLWVQLGSDKSGPMRIDETESLLRVVQAASSTEPENAFWRQMTAVYLHRLGRTSEARAVWIAASNCKLWNDYQSVRLVKVRAWLQSKTGTHLSWQSVLPYYQRSLGPAQEIVSAARGILIGVHDQTRPDLELRLATLRNASLLTNGSQSITVGQMGAQIFDIGCGINPRLSPKRSDRYRARYALKAQVEKVFGADSAESAEKLLRSNEAWGVLTSTDPAIENPSEVLAYSALTGSLPGMFFALGIVGLVLSLLGWSAKFWPLASRPRLALLLVVGLGLALAAGSAVGLPLIGVLVALAVTFQALTPVEGDRRQLRRLGSLFEIAVTVFASALFLVLGMLYFGDIAPGASSLLLLGVPPEYLFGSTRLIGVGIVILCLVLVVPPAWAITHRVSTAQVVRLMLQRLGTILAAVCLSLAVILTPIMLVVDRGLSEKMDKLMENEPLYYVHP